MQEKYSVGQSVGNFKLIKIYPVKEQDLILYEFKHSKTEARLIFAQSNDDNKLFSVSFKTIPDNSTGVFHILEHSVLCGSDKYPVKEPFVELIKSSMNTFLNAMTFPDKTMYPVSSRNEKDFLNLTEVYLDAAFRPNIYKNKNIFLQEGWHFDIKDKNDKATFNGVVYNEMKGVESSVDGRIENEIMNMLYPSNCYQYVSGGYTPDIPNLTYEAFIDYHKRFYNPDNAIFYLEGDMDIEKPVALIEEYLNPTTPFDKSITNIPYQTKHSNEKKIIEYPISEDESLEEKTHIVFGKVLNNYDEKIKLYAYTILSDYLTGSIDAPLTKAIISNKLGQDVAFIIENGIQQPFMYLQIVNTDEDKYESIKNTIKEIVNNLVKNGLDKDEIEATINHMEFTSKEITEPRALNHNINVLNSYLYGGEPDLYLTCNEAFEELRELINSDYYEKLLEELFNEQELVTLIAKPSNSLSTIEAEQETKRVAMRQNTWSDSDTEKAIQECISFDNWQKTPDSEEELKTIPQLSISDVNPLPIPFETIEDSVEGIKVLKHPVPISNIAYINMYFPIDKSYIDKLPSLSFLTNLLINVPTKNYDVLTLIRNLKKYVGGLNFKYSLVTDTFTTESCKLYLQASISTLKVNIDKTIELVKEIVSNTLFDDIEGIKSILLQNLESFRNDIIESGHSMGARNALSNSSAKSRIKEELDGVTCYNALKKILENEDNTKEFIILMKKSLKDIFTRNGLILSISTSPDEMDSCIDSYKIKELINTLDIKEEKNNIFSYKDFAKNSSFVQIPASISYACAGVNLNTIDENYNGAMAVAANIINYEYLWNKIRVQGGAYGAGMRIDAFGDIFYYSYRDPSGVNSLSVYKTTSDFLEEYALSDTDFSKYIISTVASKEPLLTPKAYANTADDAYLCNLNFEARHNRRKEMLNTSKENLIEVSKNIRDAWNNMSECLVSSKSDGKEFNKSYSL